MRTEAYDFQSIMHYRSTTFAIDPTLPTIVANNMVLLDGSTAPTALDALMVNDSYHNHVGVVRRSDSGVDAAGEAAEIAVVSVNLDTVITAVRTGADTLKLILWTVDSFGGILRGPDSGDLGAEASDIAVALGQLVVTAFRSGHGRLQLASWTVNLATSEITLTHPGSDQLAGEAKVIQIVSLTPTLFLTACQTGSGRLLLIRWLLQPDGSFIRVQPDVDQANEVSEISLTVIQPRLQTQPPAALVATTVRDGDGRVRLLTWRVGLEEGSTIEPAGDSKDLMGEGTLVASVIDQFGHVVVSCRNGSDNLELITLEVLGDGGTVKRLHDSGSQAGKIGGSNALIARPGDVMSAVALQGPGGNPVGGLKLIKWRVDGFGEITRAGDSSDQAGIVHPIAIGSTTQPTAPVVTAVGRGNGDLELISWDDAATHGED